ncbi:hypothetical protein AOT31_01015 [Corynebacterium ulcerans]|nr:hypothetical protein [Corynebacterium ulcerans]KPJ25233.1 hypothetical protein AOT31_01015 [Corynebacterium ulcerans]
MPIERLPMKVQPAAYRVRAFLMTDSTALLLLFIVQIAVGFYYLPNVLGDPLQWHRPVESIMPIVAWAWVHIAVGLLCLVAAFTDRGHIDVVALAAATGLNLSWTFTPFIVESAEIHVLITERWMCAQAVLWLVGALMSAIMWAVWHGKWGAF